MGSKSPEWNRRIDIWDAMGRRWLLWFYCWLVRFPVRLFHNPRNFLSIRRQISHRRIIAIGMTFVIILADIITHANEKVFDLPD
ncbi:MAG: hypothetical protein WCT05_00170 [Lentisphaeria bacterium]